MPDEQTPHIPSENEQPGASAPPASGSEAQRGVNPWMWAAIALAVVVVVIIAVWVGLSFRKVAVPNVVGKVEEDATVVLADAGFKLGTVTTVTTESVAPDTVISQKPAAGTRERKGTVVSLTVAAPLAMIDLPGVTEKASEDAAQILAKAGLKVVSFRDFHASARQGTVFGQLPAAGERVRQGSTVVIGVSKGKPPETGIVPGGAGLGQDEALQALDTSGFQSVVVKTYSSTVPTGSVIAEFPTPGTKTQPGSTVGVLVSLGTGTTSVAVPNVTTLSESAATSKLKGAGLKVQVFDVFSDVVASGFVAGELPGAGTSVAPGATIGIAVSRGSAPASVRVPSVTSLSSADAISALKKAGLISLRVPGYGVPGGLVIGQMPESGTDVFAGSHVALLVDGVGTVGTPPTVQD